MKGLSEKASSLSYGLFPFPRNKQNGRQPASKGKTKGYSEGGKGLQEGKRERGFFRTKEGVSRNKLQKGCRRLRNKHTEEETT